MVKSYGWVVGVGGDPRHYTVISWDLGYSLFPLPSPIPNPSPNPNPKSKSPIPVPSLDHVGLPHDLTVGRVGGGPSGPCDFNAINPPFFTFWGTFIQLSQLGQGHGLGLGPGLDNNHQSHFIHVLPPYYEVVIRPHDLFRGQAILII